MNCVCARIESSCSEIYHVFEDILLMHVDSDESLVLGPVNLGELLGRAVNEGGQQVTELVTHRLHDLLVSSRVAKRDLSVTCPQHLDAQQTNLKAEAHIL